VSGLRRGALVFGILALLLFADGIYLVATHKNPNGDTGTLFGNSSYYLNAGTVVVLSGVLVLVASVIMWLVDVHRQDKERERRRAAGPPTSEPPGPSGRTASRAPAKDPPAKDPPAKDPPASEPARQSGRTASKA
jgi:hypothetical protein